MRVLVALTYYRPHYSGLTIYAERVARALAQRGHQVTVLTSRFDPHLPGRETVDGVEIVRPRVLFRISKGVIMPSMPVWAWRLIRQAEVVHLHVPQLDAAPIALTARLLRRPVVMTYHCDLRLPSGPVHTIANLASDFANHITARRSQVIVHNSRDYAAASPFLSSYMDRVYPVPPPVELVNVTQVDRQAFRAKFELKPDQRAIGMVARLATEKGVEYLAQALPAVLEKHPGARVLFVGPHQNLVGEQAYARRLQPLIERLGEHWSFLGILSPLELASFYHECDLTVLPSINSTESYGIVQVESMLCGTPVVASDRPGVRIPVRMTGCGLTVPPGDPTALARAIIAVLDNPTAYRGRPESLLRQSNPDEVAQEYEKVYRLAAELNTARFQTARV
jgi:glycosyltransferase involved in cell wall biosynthesis